MPYNLCQDELSLAQVALIKDWIDEGAQNN